MLKWLQLIPARYIWTALAVVAVFALYQLSVRTLRGLSSSNQLSTPYVILRRVFRWMAVLLGGLVALQTLGFLEAAWASLTAAFTLIAVGFVAMWSVLSHATCAVVMMLSRPFNIGDTLEFVETPNIRGEVVDFSLLFTVLRAESGDMIQVPNNVFFQRIVRRKKGDVEIALDEQLERNRPRDWSEEP